MNTLCSTCVYSIWCPTWCEWKCKVTERRIYDPIIQCSDYKKRNKDFKDPKCQCEDCLGNDDLWDEEEQS